MRDSRFGLRCSGSHRLSPHRAQAHHSLSGLGPHGTSGRQIGGGRNVTGVRSAAWSTSLAEKGSTVVQIRLFKPNPAPPCERHANIRESPRVPARASRLQLRRTKAPFAVLSRSPLTDSNRRPPPYHGGSEAVLAGTAGHSRSRFSCKSVVCPVSPVPTRARECSGRCTRLVPAARCLFVKQATGERGRRSTRS